MPKYRYYFDQSYGQWEITVFKKHEWLALLYVKIPVVAQALNEEEWNFTKHINKIVSGAMKSWTTNPYVINQIYLKKPLPWPYQEYLESIQHEFLQHLHPLAL